MYLFIKPLMGCVVNLYVLKLSLLGQTWDFCLFHETKQVHQRNAAHLLSPSKRKGILSRNRHCDDTGSEVRLFRIPRAGRWSPGQPLHMQLFL